MTRRESATLSLLRARATDGHGVDSTEIGRGHELIIERLREIGHRIDEAEVGEAYVSVKRYTLWLRGDEQEALFTGEAA